MLNEFNLYASIPKKPLEECKTLSVVITKDEQPFCWITYPNYRYRRANLGLTPTQIEANNEKATNEQNEAFRAARAIVKLGNAKRLSCKHFDQKQLTITRAFEMLKSY